MLNDGLQLGGDMFIIGMKYTDSRFCTSFVCLFVCLFVSLVMLVETKIPNQKIKNSITEMRARSSIMEVSCLMFVTNYLVYQCENEKKS